MIAQKNAELMETKHKKTQKKLTRPYESSPVAGGVSGTPGGRGGTSHYTEATGPPLHPSPFPLAYLAILLPKIPAQRNNYQHGASCNIITNLQATDHSQIGGMNKT